MIGHATSRFTILSMRARVRAQRKRVVRSRVGVALLLGGAVLCVACGQSRTQSSSTVTEAHATQPLAPTTRPAATLGPITSFPAEAPTSTVVGAPPTAPARAMVFADPVFDTVAKVRVVNLCLCVKSVELKGEWDDGSTLKSATEALAGPGELEFAVAAPEAASLGSYVVAITFDSGDTATYPDTGSFTVLRYSAPLRFALDMDDAVLPGSRADIATAAVPAPSALPSRNTGDDLGVFVPQTDTEAYGPSVVAVAEQGLYVADPVNQRVIGYLGTGEVVRLDLGLPSDYLRDLSSMVVSESDAALYLQVRDVVHAFDLGGAGERWHLQVPGAVSRSLMGYEGGTTILAGTKCISLDARSGKIDEGHGICVLADVRNGWARVLVQVNGSSFATIDFTSSDDVERIEIGSVDPESGSVYGTAQVRSADGTISWVAFSVSKATSTAMRLPEMADLRFSVAMPLTTASGSVGIWYGDDAVSVSRVNWKELG